MLQLAAAGASDTRSHASGVFNRFERLTSYLRAAKMECWRGGACSCYACRPIESASPHAQIQRRCRAVRPLRPEGRMRPGASRDAMLPDGLARQAHGVLPPGSRVARARIAAARRRFARRSDAALPAEKRRGEAARLHAAIFRRAGARPPGRTPERRFRLSRRRGKRRRLRAVRSGLRRSESANPRGGAFAGSVRAPRLQHRAERLRQRQGGRMRPARRRRRNLAVRQSGKPGRDLGVHCWGGGECPADQGPRQDLADAGARRGLRTHRCDQARHRGRRGIGARAVFSRRAEHAPAAADHHGIHAPADGRDAGDAPSLAWISRNPAHAGKRRLHARRGRGMTDSQTVTAAILVIGDEILSGRTKDRNIGYIAEYVARLGVEVREVRVVPDDEGEIVAALNALRARWDYVFSTGGIGPTHDDITADAVAKAFGVPIGEDPRALAIMMQRYQPADLTPARRRMSRIPEGAELIENPVSKAPGFRIGNVIVMAGVPSVMQAMLDYAVKGLRTGQIMLVETIEAAGLPEGRYGAPLGEIAAARPQVSIGSYPSYADGTFRNQIVVRGKDAEAVADARRAVEAMIAELIGDGKPP